MNKRNLMVLGGVAALSLALIALPAPPAKSQAPDDPAIARLEQKLEQLRARLEGRRDQLANLAESRALLASQQAFAQHREAIEQLEALPGMADDELNLVLDEEGSGWLGVELHEVTNETAKELKLPAERGVVLGSIVPDSPAAKAGLKEKDVITEINGQRVEGAAQFRRMIHEIPAGRTVQLTLWRDGRAQTVNVTLGKAEERRHSFKMITPAPGAPGTFTFHMPEIAEIPPFEWNGTVLLGGQPRLGIDVEDLSGQLGTFFGAPDGEGPGLEGRSRGRSGRQNREVVGHVLSRGDARRIALEPTPPPETARDHLR